MLRRMRSTECAEERMVAIIDFKAEFELCLVPRPRGDRPPVELSLRNFAEVESKQPT
jgi:hypothetical protein